MLALVGKTSRTPGALTRVTRTSPISLGYWTIFVVNTKHCLRSAFTPYTGWSQINIEYNFMSIWMRVEFLMLASRVLVMRGRRRSNHMVSKLRLISQISASLLCRGLDGLHFKILDNGGGTKKGAFCFIPTKGRIRRLKKKGN